MKEKHFSKRCSIVVLILVAILLLVWAELGVGIFKKKYKLRKIFFPLLIAPFAGLILLAS